VRCKTIILDEAPARTAEERESAKIAKAMRAAVRDLPPAEDQTGETEPPGPASKRQALGDASGLAVTTRQ
jgi:hypothetical protein